MTNIWNGLIRVGLLVAVLVGNQVVGSERDVAYQDIYFGEPLKEAWEKISEIIGVVYVGGSAIRQGLAQEQPVRESSEFYSLWFRSSEERRAWEGAKHSVLQRFIVNNISSVMAYRNNDIYLTAYMGKKPNSAGVSGVLAMTIEYRKIPTDVLEKAFKEKYPNAVLDGNRLEYLNNGCVYRLYLPPPGDSSYWRYPRLTVFSDKYIDGYRKDYEAELAAYLNTQKKQEENAVRF